MQPFIVKGANHTDLYDSTAGKIPFDKFEQFCLIGNLAQVAQADQMPRDINYRGK